MENISKEVKNFITKFKSIASSGRRFAQNLLKEQLDTYRTDKTKLFFLTELRKSISEEKIKHEKTCRTSNCSTSNAFDTGLFVIDEELEVMSQYFQPETKTNNPFSFEEISSLHRKLDEILDRFQKVDFGHEILGEELEIISEDIDTLKQHFSLDKKSWFQFAFIKFASIGAAYGIEKGIVEGMYSELTQQVENATSLFIQ